MAETSTIKLKKWKIKQWNQTKWRPFFTICAKKAYIYPKKEENKIKMAIFRCWPNSHLSSNAVKLCNTVHYTHVSRKSKKKEWMNAIYCHIYNVAKKQGGGANENPRTHFLLLLVSDGWRFCIVCWNPPKNRRIAEKPNVEKLQNVMMERSLAKIAPWWWWWHTYIIRIWPVDVIIFFFVRSDPSK